MRVGARWAIASDHPEQLAGALRLLGSVEKFASLSIREEMDDDEDFAVVIRDLWQKSTDHMFSSANKSDTSTVELLARALLTVHSCRDSHYCKT